MLSKLNSQTLQQIISGTDLFLNLSQETKEHLAQTFARVHVAKNKVVVRQGEHGDALYLLPQEVLAFTLQREENNRK